MPHVVVYVVADVVVCSRSSAVVGTTAPQSSVALPPRFGLKGITSSIDSRGVE
jgi:hypothetical protein